jgi:hypothetical protein
MGVNSTNHNLRNLIINEEELGNHHIRLSDTRNSSTISGSEVITENDYWKFRIKSENTVNISNNMTGLIIDDYSGDIDLGITSSNALDNLVGSRWAISGGTGEFSVEFNTSGGSASLAYFIWDFNQLTPSYIFYERKTNPPETNVSFIKEGVSQWQITPDYSHIKIYWDRETGLGELLSSQDGISYSLDGTYSISTNNGPYFVYSFINGKVDEFDTINLIGVVISNHQQNGKTGSMYGITSNLPPVTAMMNQFSRY